MIYFRPVRKFLSHLFLTSSPFFFSMCLTLLLRNWKKYQYAYINMSTTANASWCHIIILTYISPDIILKYIKLLLFFFVQLKLSKNRNNKIIGVLRIWKQKYFVIYFNTLQQHGIKLITFWFYLRTFFHVLLHRKYLILN